MLDGSDADECRDLLQTRLVEETMELRALWNALLMLDIQDNFGVDDRGWSW